MIQIALRKNGDMYKKGENSKQTPERKLSPIVVTSGL